MSTCSVAGIKNLKRYAEHKYLLNSRSVDDPAGDVGYWVSEKHLRTGNPEQLRIEGRRAFRPEDGKLGPGMASSLNLDPTIL